MAKKGKIKNKYSKKTILAYAITAAVAGLGFGHGRSASAAVLYWDPGTPGQTGVMGSGGSGNWDYSTTEWADGTDPSGSDVAWSDATAPNTAIFAGTSGTVNITGNLGNGNVNVNTIDFNVTGYTLSGGTITLGGTTPTIAVGGSNATISSTIAGSAGINVTGSTGTLTLGSSNSYTGGTTISGGTLSISSDSNLGSAGGVTINGGTLQVTGSGITTSRVVTLGSSGGTIDVTGASFLDLTTAVTGSGGLTLNGDNGNFDDLELDAAANYNGATAINSGQLFEQTTNALPTGTALSIGGPGTLSLGGFSQTVASLNGSGLVQSGPSATLTVNGGGTYSGLLNGAGLALAVGGGGTLVLSGGSNYGGGTTISGGELSISADNNLGSVTGGLTINGGTLQVTGTGFATSRVFTLGSSGGTIDVTGSSFLELTTAMTGSGGLTVNGDSGANYLQLNAAANYGGGTTINSGQLFEGTAGALPSGTALSIAGPGTLVLGTNSSQTVASLNGSGEIYSSGTPTLTVNGGGTFSGSITGSPSLAVAGGTLVLSGSNSYSGSTSIYGTGTLTVGSNNAIPSGSAVSVGNGATNGTLNLGTFTNTVASLVFGSAGDTLNITLGGSLTTTSSTNLNNGTINVSGTTSPSVGEYTLIAANSLSGSLNSSTSPSVTFHVESVGNNVELVQEAAVTMVADAAYNNNVRTGAQTIGVNIANTAPTGSDAAVYSLGAPVGNTLNGAVGSRTANNGTPVDHQTGTYTASAGINNNTVSITNTGINAWTNSPPNVTITQTAYDFANANYAGGVLNFGNVRTNAGVPASQTVSFTNQTVTSAAYQDNLGAILPTTSNGNVTATGFTGLAAGAPAANLTVSVGSTANAGSLNSTVTLNLVSQALGGTGLSNGVPTIVGGGAVTTTGGIYDYAQAQYTGGNISFGFVHSGGGANQTVAFGNPLIGSNPTYQDTLDVTNTSTNNANVTATGFSGLVASAGGATTANLTLSASGAGSLNSTVSFTLVSDGSASGLANGVPTVIGGGVITTTGTIYTGTSVWNTNGSGTWGTLANNFGVNWGSGQGSPGLDPGHTTSDTATFDNTALTAGSSATVTLDGANPSLLSITFNTPTGGYTLATGTGGSLTLATTGGQAAINVTGTQTISAAIAGTNGIAISNFAGAGKLDLSGNNTYTGGTTVSSGILQAGSATAFGASSSAVSVTAGAVLDLNGTNYTNTNSLTLNGTGIASGGALINSSGSPATYAGLVALGSNSSIVASGGNITLSNAGIITGPGNNLTLGGANNGTIASIIGTTSGNVTMAGTGSWTLNGANTFGGGLNIQSGTLVGSTSASALGGSGTGTVTLGNTSGNSPATLLISTTGLTFANPIVLATNASVGQLTITNSGAAVSTTFSGGITGTNNVTLSENSTTGVITFQTGGINNAGTITNSGTGVTANFANAATPGASVNISTSIGANVTGIVQNGTSDLVLGGNNTFVGGITIASGRIDIANYAANNNTALGAAANVVTLGNSAAGATLNFAGGLNGNGSAATIANKINVGGSGADAITADDWNPTFSGSITLSNNLTIATLNAANSTIVVSGGVTGTGNIHVANDFTGGSSVSFTTAAVNNVGTILFDNASVNGGTAGTGGSTNNITGGVGSNVTAITENSATNPLTISGAAITVNAGGTTLTNSNTAVFTVSGGIVGTGSLTLNNNNTTASGITISGTGVNNAGTIINSGNSSGAVLISGPVGSNITSIAENSLSSPLNISGALTVNGGGTTLTDASGAQSLTLSGGVIGTGNLTINNNSATTNGISLTANNINNAGLITNSGTGSGTVTISTQIQGNVTGIVENASNNSALSLTQGNTFTSAVKINAGTIIVGNTTALGGVGGSGNVIFGNNASGTLSLNGQNVNLLGLSTGTPVGTAVVQDGAAGNSTLTLLFATATSNTFGGTLQNGGAGTLALAFDPGGGGTANGTLTLTGSSSYTGGTTVGTNDGQSNGTLVLGNNNALGTGTLSLAGSMSLQGTGGGTITIANPVTYSPNGATVTINGSTALVFTGSFADTIGSGNGQTHLAISDTAGTTFTGTFTLVGNTTQVIQGTGNALFTGTSVITGNAGGASNLSYTGSGTITLQGSANYTGSTTVAAGGALNLQSNNALGTTSGTTIATGAALQLQGGISIGNLPLTINSTGDTTGTADGAIDNISGNNTYGGTISLGSASTISSDSGTLSLTNIIQNGQNLTLNATAADLGAVSLNAANTYTGTTTIGNGRVIIGANAPSGANGALGNNATAVVWGNGQAGATSIVTNGAFTVARAITETGTTNSSFTIGGIQTAGVSTFTGNLTMTETTMLTSASGGQVNFATGVISGATQGVTVVGGGAVLLSGVNTYSSTSGTTTVENGTLIAGAAVNSGAAGPFGNSATAIALGDATTISTPFNASLLTGGAFAIARPVQAGANNNAYAGTLTVGGNTDNNSSFTGLITLDQNLNVSQVVSATTNALSLTAGVTSGAAGTQTLNFAGPGNMNVSTTAIGGGAGTIAVKTTGGVTTFSVANTYIGSTAVNGGVLQLAAGGSTASGSAVTVGGASASGTPILTGVGTVNGALTINGGVSGILAPGTNTNAAKTFGAIGTFNAAGGLTLNSGSILDDDFTTGLSADQVAVTGALTFGAGAGSVTININQIGAQILSNGIYQLLTFSGNVNNFTPGVSGTSNFVIGASPLPPTTTYTFSKTANSNGAIDVQIAVPTATWYNGSGNNTWDTSTLNNWATALATSATYADNDVVTFQDANLFTGSGNLSSPQTINISNGGAGVAPFSVAFTNNSVAYVITSSDGPGIHGSTGITLSGSASVTLSSANTYTGGTTLTSTAGTLKVGNSGALGGSTSPLNLNGGTLDLATGTAGAITAYNTTVGGTTTIASDNSVAAAGNTYTLGTLSIGSNQLNLTLGANVNNASAGLTFGSVTLTGSPTFNTATGATLTLGALSDGGAAKTITTSGTGTVVLGTAATTITSGTALTISGGTVDLNNATAFGTATGTVNNSGTLVLGANESLLTLTGAGGTQLGTNTLTLNPTANATYSGTITGVNGKLIMSGAASLTLSGGAANSGAVLVTAGTLQLNKTAGIDAIGAAGVTVNGGTVTLGTSNQVDDAAPVTIGGGNFNVGAFTDTIGSLSITSGSVSGAGSLVLAGAGAATVSGGTVSAGLTIGSGSLTVTTTGATNASVTGAVNGTGNISLNENGTGIITLGVGAVNNLGSITNNGTGTTGNINGNVAVPAGSVNVTAPIGANVTSIVQNSATSDLVLGGNSTAYANGIVINAGRVDISDSAGNNGNSALGTAADVVTLGSSAANVAINFNARLSSGTSGDATIPAIIHVNGTGANVIGVSDYDLILTGSITLNNDTVTFANLAAGSSFMTVQGGVTGTGNIVVSNDSTNNGSIMTFSNAAINNHGTITFNNAQVNGGGVATATGTNVISANIGSNVTGIIENSLEPLSLTGTNTLVGTSTVQSGTILIGVSNATNVSGALGPNTNSVTLGNAGVASTANLLTNGAFTFSNPVNVVSVPSGTLSVGGNAASASSFTGLITLSNGLNVSQVANGTVTLAGGITSGTATLEAVTFSGPGTMAVNTVGIGGGAGSLAVTVSGGTASFGASNSYTGNTAVNGGRLVLAQGGSLAATNITVASAGTFAPNPTTGNSVSAAGSLTLNSSTLDMSGDGNAGTFSLTLAGTNLTATTSTFKFDLGLNGGTTVTDQIMDSGSLSLTGNSTITMVPFGSGALTPGTYTLITAAAGVTPNFILSNGILTYGSSLYKLSLVNTPSTVESLTIANVPVLSWTGSAGAPGTWDINNTQNWANNTPAATTYVDGSLVSFNDTSALTGLPITQTQVTIGTSAISPTIVSPVGVIFNNAVASYTIGGTGGIGSAATPSAATLTKNFAGTVTLTNSNNYTGATTINGGTLLLDYSGFGAFTNATLPTNIIGSSSQVVLGGGTLSVKGSGGSNTQALGGLTVNPGASAVTVNSNGGTTSLTLGAITRTVAGGTVNFTLPTTGNITTTTANAVATGSTIIGGYATVGGNTWAVNTAGNITGLATYQSSSNSTNGNANMDINSDGGWPGVATTYYSLRISTNFNNPVNGNPNTAGFTYTIASGGILMTSAVSTGSINFAGTGASATAAFTSGNGLDLIVTQNDTSGFLELPIITNNGGTSIGLTTSGPGTVILGRADTYTGPTIINGGTLDIATVAQIQTSPLVSIASGATFLNTGGLTLTSTQTIQGSGTVSGALTTVSGTNLSPGFSNIGTLTTGSLTLATGTKLNYYLGTPGTNVPSLAPGIGGLIAASTVTLPAGSVVVNLTDNANANSLGSMGGGFYELISYTALAGTAFSASSFSIGTSSLTGRQYQFTSTGTQIDLIVAGQALTWTNSVANPNAWDTTSTNWSNGTGAGSATMFASFAPVTFQDTNTVTSTTLSTPQTVSVQSAGVDPYSVAFTNNAVNYIINNAGTNGIMGAGSLTVSGTGSVTLNGSNSYTGGTVLSSGKLIANNAAALGGATSPLQLNGGTLDLNLGTGTNFGYNTTIGGTPVTIVSDTAGGTTGVTHTLGTLSIGADTLNLNAGATQTTGTAGLTFGTATLTGNAVFNTAASTNLTLGALGGQFTVTKQGSGTLTLNTVANANRNAAGSAVTLTLGTIVVGNATALGTNAVPLQLNGGTLDLNVNTGTNFGYATTVGGTPVTIVSDTAGGTTGLTHTLGTLSIAGDQLNLTAGGSVTIGTAGLTFGATTLTASTAVFDTAANTLLTLGAIGGNFAFTKQDSGTMTLASASTRNNATGITNMSGGRLNLDIATALDTTAATGPLNLSGGTTAFEVAAGATYDVGLTTVSGTSTIESNHLGGGAGVTQTLTTLSIGANQLNITGGAGVTSGTAGVTFGSVTLTGAPTFNITNPAGGGVTQLSLGAVTNSTFTATITGSGNLAQTGVWGIGAGSGGITIGTGVNTGFTGTVTLNQTNGFTGSLTLNSGTLEVDNAQALGAGAATFVTNGGTIDNSNNGITVTANNAQTWNGSFAYLGTFGLNMGAGAVSLAAPITITTTANQLVEPGAITGGANSITKLGAGILALSGNNNFSGGVAIKNGTLSSTTTNANNFGSGTITLGDVANTGLAVALRIDGTGDTTYANPINVVGTGAATIMVTNWDETFSGSLTLNNTNVTLATGVLSNNDAPAFSGGITGAGNVTVSINGTNIANATTHFTFSTNPINNTGSLTFNNAAVTAGGITGAATTWNETTANSISTTIGAHVTTLTLGSVNANLITLSLSGANTAFAGPTIINSGGVLQLGNVNALADSTLNNSGAAVASSVTFTVGGNNTYNLGGLTGSGALSIGANTLSVGGNNSTTIYSGAIANTAGNFTKVGNGSLTLAGGNLYTGATSDTSGTLIITGTLGNSAVTVGAATLQLNGASAISQNLLTVNNAAGVVTENTANALSGTAALSESAGLVTLSQSNNFSGATTLSGGTLALGNNSALGTSAVTFSGGTLLSTTNGVAITNSISDTGTATIGGSNTLQLGGTFTNSGGNRTLTISNSALTTISGNVYLSEAAGTGRTLNVNGTGNLTVSGPIADFNGAGTPGSLTLAAGYTGTVTLNAVNTYTGATLISAGTLMVGDLSHPGALASIQGTGLTINGATAVLRGHGNINAPVNFLQGTIFPGGSIGTMNMASLTMSNGDNYDYDFVTPAPYQNHVAGSTNDSINITQNAANTLVFPGVGTVTLMLDPSSSDQLNSGSGSYKIFSYTNAGAVKNFTGGTITGNGTDGSIVLSGFNSNTIFTIVNDPTDDGIFLDFTNGNFSITSATPTFNLLKNAGGGTVSQSVTVMNNASANPDTATFTLTPGAPITATNPVGTINPGSSANGSLTLITSAYIAPGSQLLTVTPSTGPSNTSAINYNVGEATAAWTDRDNGINAETGIRLSHEITGSDNPLSNALFNPTNALTAQVSHNGTYGGLDSVAHNVQPGGTIFQSEATILQGTDTNITTNTVTMNWRTAATIETTNPTNPPITSGNLISDVVRLSGLSDGTGNVKANTSAVIDGNPYNAPIDETDTFVLQMKPSILLSSDVNAATPLVWLDPISTDPNPNDWVLANVGDFNSAPQVIHLATGGALNYDGSFSNFQNIYEGGDLNLNDYLGAFGYDPAGGDVWAVINHDGQFAVVPEPTSLGLLGIGAIGLLARKRKNRA